MPLDSSNFQAVTYQEERFTDLREEGAMLFAEHWLEGRQTVPFRSTSTGSSTRTWRRSARC